MTWQLARLYPNSLHRYNLPLELSGNIIYLLVKVYSSTSSGDLSISDFLMCLVHLLSWAVSNSFKTITIWCICLVQMYNWISLPSGNVQLFCHIFSLFWDNSFSQSQFTRSLSLPLWPKLGIKALNCYENCQGQFISPWSSCTLKEYIIYCFVLALIWWMCILIRLKEVQPFPFQGVFGLCCVGPLNVVKTGVVLCQSRASALSHQLALEMAVQKRTWGALVDTELNMSLSGSLQRWWLTTDWDTLARPLAEVWRKWLLHSIYWNQTWSTKPPLHLQDTQARPEDSCVVQGVWVSRPQNIQKETEAAGFIQSSEKQNK